MKTVVSFPTLWPAVVLMGNLALHPAVIADPCDEPRFAGARGLPSAALANASAAGDFNGDSKLDLAIGNLNTGLANTGMVSVLLGSGFATFQPHVDYPTVGNPGAVHVANMNMDTDLDLVVVSLFGSGSGVLHGNGNGTFQPNATFFGGNSLTVGDLDHDGIPDTVGASAPFISAMLSNGDLTFHATNFYLVSFFASPSSIAIGDMNGDGTNDVVVGTTAVSPSRGTIAVLLGKGDGTLHEATNTVASINNSKIALGNFNGDVARDVAALDYDAGTVMILLGVGNGTLQSNATYNTGINPVSIAVGDFDGDNDSDIAVVNQTSHTVSVLLGNGSGSFQLTNYDVGVGLTSITAGDFTGDAVPDLAVTQLGINGESIELWMLVGNGDGTFQVAPHYAAGSGPIGVQAGDFNGDGLRDLIVANAFSTNVSLFLNNGDGTFQAKVDYGVGSAPQSIAIADYNNDGTNDIAVANQLTGSVSLRMGKGDGTFFNLTTVGPIIVGSTYVVAGRFNSDTNMDVLAIGGLGFSVYMGTGFGTFAAPVETIGNYLANIVATGHFNNDGNLDFVAGKTGTNEIAVLLGNGNGTFQPPVTYAAGTNVQSVALADFNGDMRLDIVVANYGCNTCTNPDLITRGSISVLLGNANGTFQPAVHYQVALRGTMTGVATGDFNGDGKQDVVASDTTLQVASVLLGNGDGTFQSPVHFAIQNLPKSLVAADLDGDGRLDLAAANQAVNSVSVLLNNCLFDVGAPVCSLAPSVATNMVDEAHAVGLTLTADGTPVSGAAVHFFVSAGPNAGENGNDVTDASGLAGFQYVGQGGVGTDTIMATGRVSGANFSCSAAKTWTNVSTTTCSLSPSSATNDVGEIHSVTSTVLTNGLPVAGVTVHFLITAGPDVGFVGSDVTDVAGQAVFAYTNNGAPGTDAIMATGIVAEASFSCSASKLWIEPLPDLQVTKSDSPDPVTAGNNLTYTITVANSGILDASSVAVTDALPASVNFVSANASQGNCAPGVGNVLCDLGGLAIGQSATVTVVVTTTTAGTITNTASASSPEGDLNAANNSAQAVTTVGAPLPDLTAVLANGDLVCSNTAKGVACTSSGTLQLANNGTQYGSLSLDLAATGSMKPGKPTKWKIAGLLNIASFDLGANPRAILQVFLSDDATFSGDDLPLLKKPLDTEVLDSQAGSGKAIKLSIKPPKGVDPSGKLLILVIDAAGEVAESNENNNGAAIGPLP